MNYCRTLNIILLLITLTVGTTISGCSSVAKDKLTVVTGSSLLTCVIREIGGDKIEVINLIPPAQHPGDFNVKPGDIQTLATADLFILHGWPGEKYADKFVSSAHNPNLKVIAAGVEGNWMIPSVQLAATEKVTAVLKQVDSANSARYQKDADRYKQRIQNEEAEIKDRLSKAKVTQINVIASVRQADFLKWAGFNVIATYINTESLTPQTVKELVDQGRSTNVMLVVNNLQDSADAGKGIAEELGAKSVNLSNFPGGLANTDTWEKALDRNIDLLLDAIAN